MQQMILFEDTQRPHIVNVASVPQRSPFRYPGGKTWIVPYIRRWLASQMRQHFDLVPIHPVSLIEPFAGGGIVSLTCVAEGLTDCVTMVEIDEDVAAVWQTILSDEDEGWLAHEIMSFELTVENVEACLVRTELTLREQAFRTILRNRVQRGGILAPGAGLMKNGENGKGIGSRWYPATLRKRIEDIVKLRDRISFVRGDGLKLLRENAGRADTVFFIDPPYTVAGKKAGSRLYRYADVDHEELFEIARGLRGDFLMTYDDVEGARALARKHGFDMHTIPMKNTHHAKMTELLIGRDLEWLRQPFACTAGA